MKSSLLLAIALLSALSMNSFAQTGTEAKSDNGDKAPVEKIVKKGKKHHKKVEDKKEEKKEDKKEEKKEEAKKEEAKK
jgi:hypothetical protein